MSPVEMCGRPYSSATCPASVPLPAPGGPKKIKFMLISECSFVRTCEYNFKYNDSFYTVLENFTRVSFAECFTVIISNPPQDRCFQSASRTTVFLQRPK